MQEGRAAAVARMRTEDRRSLVEAHIPNLRRIPQTHEMLVDAEERWRIGFERWRDAEVAAIELVRLLPWSDRASWARVATNSPWRMMPGSIDSEYAPPPEDPRDQAMWRNYIGVNIAYMEGYEIDVAYLRTGGIGGSGEPPAILEWAERLHDFDEHLRRQLRPSVVGRWRTFAYKLHLLTRGPYRV